MKEKVDYALFQFYFSLEETDAFMNRVTYIEAMIRKATIQVNIAVMLKWMGNVAIWESNINITSFIGIMELWKNQMSKNFTCIY